MSLRARAGVRVGPLALSDVLLASLLLAGSIAQLVLDHDFASEPWTVAVSFFAVPLVAFRRQAPLAVTIAFVSLVIAQEIFEGKTSSNPVALFVATLLIVYTVGAHSSLRRSFIGLGVLLTAELVVALHEGLGVTSDWAAGMIVNVALWLVGRSIRTLRTRATGLERHVGSLERDRERHQQEAVEAERARIARELHDVISHSVSLMVVQAGAGDLVFESEPERAHDALRAVQSTGRQAIEDLGRLLRVLREPTAEPAVGPEPGLEQLLELVERTRAAGLPVKLTVIGERTSLSPGLDAAAYRIVQEALTNALKHARDASAHVTLRYEPAALSIDVIDDGRGQDRGPGTGHGLVGMHERASVFGGELSAEARPDGGFAVRARLPTTQGAE